MQHDSHHMEVTGRIIRAASGREIAPPARTEHIMTGQFGPGWPPSSFTAFTSAADEGRNWSSAARDELDRAWEAGHGRHLPPPREITVIERRVLAQERILQALIGHLADEVPEILNQMKERFACGQNMGDHEKEFASTERYIQDFIGSIEREVARHHAANTSASKGTAMTTKADLMRQRNDSTCEERVVLALEDIADLLKVVIDKVGPRPESAAKNGESGTSNSSWENEGGALQREDPLPPEIERRVTETFHVGPYRYTHLKDAMEQVRRGRHPHR